MVTCENLSLGYGGSVILSGLSFALNDGGYLCVIGENGAGKSTLIRTLLGLVPPLSGRVRIPEGVGYLPQQTEMQKDFPASVWEVVLSGCQGRLGWRPFYSRKDNARALDAMSRMNILNLKAKCYRELSGGQQQRVLLARALCAAKCLLVLDEPANSLGEKYSSALRRSSLMLETLAMYWAFPFVRYALVVGALAVGYLLMNVFSTSANLSGDVCTTLFGFVSILTLTPDDVSLSLGLAAGVMIVFVMGYNRIFAVTFDEDFAHSSGGNAQACNLVIAVIVAVVIVLAMRLVGSLLISALVIFPALSAMSCVGRVHCCRYARLYLGGYSCGLDDCHCRHCSFRYFLRVRSCCDMKKLVCAFMFVLVFAGAGGAQKVDLDLSKFSSVMVYSGLFDVMANPNAVLLE